MNIRIIVVVVVVVLAVVVVVVVVVVVIVIFVVVVASFLTNSVAPYGDDNAHWDVTRLFSMSSEVSERANK